MSADTQESNETKLTTLTRLELFRRVAVSQGFTLREGASRAYSEPIAYCELTDRIISELTSRGYTVERSHADSYLLRSPDGGISWGFARWPDKPGFDLTLSPYVGFGINQAQRGAILVPRVRSTSGCGVNDQAHHRLFQVLVELDAIQLPVARALAASSGEIIVHWTEFGLGGLRTLVTLFDEFKRSRRNVEELARRLAIFEPNPYPRNQQPGDECYIAESYQPTVLAQWQAQLEKFRSSLA